MSSLVKEADELRAGPMGFVVKFDVVTALSALVVMDTFYISYLTYRGSDLLSTSLGTEIILGAALYFKVGGCIRHGRRIVGRPQRRLPLPPTVPFD